MNRSTVLLIGKDGLARTVEALVRRNGGIDLDVIEGLDAAYAYGDWERVALVLIQHDRRGSTAGVVRLMRMIAASRRPVATLILGEALDEETQALLLRRGAADCLARPFDPDRLAYLLDVLTLRARQPAGDLAAQAQPPWGEPDPMVDLAERVAPQDATVLIRGEAGTGKSRLARIIHDVSPRRAGSFVTLRCATLAPETFDADLDGWGARPSSQARKLDEADEGTLVLDDIDSLPPPTQAALLHWVEEGARAALVRPGVERPARPRLIATTKTDLGEEVASGRFRADLFFRLNVIGLELTPLHARRAEIAPMAHRVLSDLAGRSVTLSGEAIQALESYGWPGNVRELLQAMEASLASGPRDRSTIDRHDLPEPVRTAAVTAADREAGEPEATTLAETKREAEFLRITQALQKNGNNRLRTASELGISRMTLYKKLYKYGIIEPPSGEQVGPGRPRRSPSPATADDASDLRGRSDPRGVDAGRDASSPRPFGAGSRPHPGKSAPALH